VGGLPALC